MANDARNAGFGDFTEPLERRSKAPLDAIVRVSGAEAKPQQRQLREGSCIIGSAPGSDIVVSDRGVSRAHVELMLAPEGVSVRDLGSRNGTFFHGERIEKMVLGFGGQLRIGSATLSIEADTRVLDDGEVFSGGAYRGIIGQSGAMRRLFAALTRLEGSLATVLVEGESGVGKERVAMALHEGSKVADGPLVTVNSGAFPKELIASELFGHRRGAFSGAFDDRRGAFESAHGGTLFLDEIGELPLELQPMLLRAIELGEVRALGDDRSKQVKVRIIAATNRELETAVQQGTFRQDLYYRLAVVRLQVPPLRQRPEDIPALVEHFAAEAGLEQLPPAIVEDMRGRSWPGNARELKNAIVAYAALGDLPARRQASTAQVDGQIKQLIDVSRPFAEQKEAIVESFTKQYLEDLLAHTGGNQSEAARVSGLNRTYLGRMLARYGFSKGR